MNNKFTKNPKVFNKSGQRRSGIITQSIPQKGQKEDPSKNDRENREFVVSKIIHLVKQGMTKEEVCMQIAKDENITSKFNYLFGEERSEEQIKKIAKTYAGWYNGRTRERREIEKDF